MTAGGRFMRPCAAKAQTLVGGHIYVRPFSAFDRSTADFPRCISA
ncbi:MAG: hypothetical protein ACOX7O_04030 [Oscillospiraceae bacterium]